MVLALEHQLGTLSTEINIKRKSIQIKCWILRQGENRVPRENSYVQSKQTLSLDPHMTPGLVLEPAGYIGARRVFSTLHQPYTHWLSRSPATRNGRPKTEFFFSIWCLAPANCVWRIGGGASPHVIMLTIYSNKQQRNGCHTYRFPPSVFGSGWLLCRPYRHHHHYKSWAYMADEKRYKSDQLIKCNSNGSRQVTVQMEWSFLMICG